MEVRSFADLQAANLIRKVQAQHDIRIAITRIEQPAKLVFSSKDAVLSKPNIRKLCDKLALQVSLLNPVQHIVKRYFPVGKQTNIYLKPTILKLYFRYYGQGEWAAFSLLMFYA